MRHSKYLSFPLSALLMFACLTACHSNTDRQNTAGDSSEVKAADTAAINGGTNSQTDNQSNRPDSIPADQLIVPGKSAGQTYINEPMSAVFKRLGKPDAGDAAMGKSMSVWYAKHDTTGYETAIFASRYTHGPDDTASLVQQILVTSPYFKLQSGLHTGAGYRQVAAAYTLTKTATFGKGARQLTVYNTGKGIAFEFNTANNCTGIYIHPVGSKGGAAYLAFHPDLERN